MKVVSLAPVWSDELRPQLLGVDEFAAPDRADANAVAKELEDADILITREFNADMARYCRRLKLLVCHTAGSEDIDRAALPKGVRLETGGGHEVPIAEYVIGYLVAMRRHLIDADRRLRKGDWHYGFLGPAPAFVDLAGSTIGLLGFGRIGREIAKRAGAFSMNVRALTMHPERVSGDDAVPGLPPVKVGQLNESGALDELLQESDAVVVCCELSNETTGLLGPRRLALLKHDAVLINVARGGIVDENGLYEVLKSGRIAGAVLDVWFQYPKKAGEQKMPSTAPFWELENVIMSPHASSWTQSFMTARLRLLAETINRFIAEQAA